MKGRAIAFLAFVQMVMISYGILLCGAACKMSGYSLAEGRPIPSGYYWGTSFRDYGIWLVVPLLIWTVWACLSASSARSDELSWRDVFNAGLGLSLLFFLLATICVLGAIAPMVRLLN